MSSVRDGTSPELSPEAVLHQLSVGHFYSRALCLVAELRIADLLADGPRSSSALAEATGTHEPSLVRVLRLLVSVGVFDEPHVGEFALTRLGRLIRTDAASSMRSSIQIFGGAALQDRWKDLEYCVRTGQPAFKARGRPNPLTALAAFSREAATFDTKQAHIAERAAMAIAAKYDFSRCRTIVDVGGGTGGVLLGILMAYPHVSGILLDQPGVAQRAEERVAERGLSGRCQVVAGDFFAEIPTGADVYLLKHVVHDWDESQARKLLSTCLGAMSHAAKLLVVEEIYPATIDQTIHSRQAATNDVNLLVSFGGAERSEAQFASLFESAGLRIGRVIRLYGRLCAIEGAKA